MKLYFQPDIVIYHHPCMDGFGAAYAVHQKWPDAGIEYVPAVHGPEKWYDAFWRDRTEGKKVLICDFCFPPTVMEAILGAAKRVLVADHHIDTHKLYGGADWLIYAPHESGASLVWKLLFDREEPPALIDHIRRIDTHQPDKSPEAACLIQATPNEFGAWEKLDDEFSEGNWATKAKGALKYRQYLTRSRAEQAERWTFSASALGKPLDLWAVNSCKETRHETCMEILGIKKAQVAGAWYIENGRMWWSLRSSGTVKVNQVAHKFDGGGHEAAAGFSVPVECVNFFTKTVFREGT